MAHAERIVKRAQPIRNRHQYLASDLEVAVGGISARISEGYLTQYHPAEGKGLRTKLTALRRAQG